MMACMAIAAFAASVMAPRASATNFGHTTGTLAEDAGGKIKIEIPAGNAVFKGTAEKEDCVGGDLGAVKATVSSKLCIEVNSSDSASLTGCGAEVTFKIDVTSGVTCA
jgi:hypothetical protein